MKTTKVDIEGSSFRVEIRIIMKSSRGKNATQVPYVVRRGGGTVLPRI